MPAALARRAGFDGTFAGVFAAESSAEIVDDDADVVLARAEGFPGECGADTEGLLGRGPDGELASGVPFGDGGTRFHGGVLGVGRCSKRL